jgi:ribonuclease HII
MTAKFDPALLPQKPDLSFELPLWESGVRHVAGIDEAGRGPLAGPVCAAAVILSVDSCTPQRLHGVRDSKQMSPAARALWAETVMSEAVSYGIGFAWPEEIDGWGILPATRLAIQRALGMLSVQPQHLLLDHLRLRDHPTPQTAITKGDARSLSIAAASILAKTRRDALMCEMDSRYPAYGFAQHKGYATAAHLRALAERGPCPIHRFSFAPLRKYQPPSVIANRRCSPGE